MKRVGTLRICLALWLCLVGAALAEERPKHAELPPGATLPDYLRYAALHNRGLAAVYHDWMAALERIPQAESLPDPRISYSYYFQEVETFVGSQRQRLGVAQSFPFWGKLDLRGDVEAKRSEAARQRFEAEKLRLFFDVTSAYARYYYLERAIEVTKENVELLRQSERFARAKFRVATGRSTDLIKAQVELGKLDDQLRSLEDIRIPTVARLNEVLNRPSTAEISPPQELPSVAVDIDQEQLLGSLKGENPELKALDSSIAAEERSVALARKDFYPDFTFGVDWIQTDRRSETDPPENGKDAVIGSVSINIPLWWGKYSAGVREAQARQRALGNRRTDRTLELTTALQQALYDFRDSERKIDLYRDGLLPKAREALGAAFTAYESEDAGFLDLLDAQRILLEFELSYERALAERTERLSQIEMIVGRSLRDDGSDDPSALEKK